MQKRHLKRTLDLYLEGNASPETAKQVEEWLSDTGGKTPAFPEPLLQEEERRILADIRSETEYPLFYPSREEKDLKQAVLVGAVVGCVFVVLLMLLHR
ncbi:MAG TPA: hypothetical protein VL547_17730 [Dinghuibacter sp.]|jgi:hypothetical protein|uniref:hypothetical protein n=1 Tax=Dinghuibacter sp. TaxID=2024697 RepID=UPI002C671CE3|nr:hypothetical protein [Dinghuibacter sp.]HTJ13884.1 hypothetical protein [Dinghuibacter sp.]